MMMMGGGCRMGLRGREPSENKTRGKKPGGATLPDNYTCVTYTSFLLFFLSALRVPQVPIPKRVICLHGKDACGVLHHRGELVARNPLIVVNTAVGTYIIGLYRVNGAFTSIAVCYSTVSYDDFAMKANCGRQSSGRGACGLAPLPIKFI